MAFAADVSSSECMKMAQPFHNSRNVGISERTRAQPNCAASRTASPNGS